MTELVLELSTKMRKRRYHLPCPKGKAAAPPQGCPGNASTQPSTSARLPCPGHAVCAHSGHAALCLPSIRRSTTEVVTSSACRRTAADANDGRQPSNISAPAGRLPSARSCRHPGLGTRCPLAPCPNLQGNRSNYPTHWNYTPRSLAFLCWCVARSAQGVFLRGGAGASTVIGSATSS